jgi:anti-sigma factor RsiW
MNEHITIECNACRDSAAELALGTLDGVERAALVDHLADCAACREAVARLTEGVAALDLLAARIEPSSTFESRLLAAMGVDPDAGRANADASVVPLPSGRTRRWSGLLAAAAVPVVVAIGAVVLAPIGDDIRPAAATSAPMIAADGKRVGDAYLFDTSPRVVVVDVSYAGGERADYQPVLQGIAADGAVVTIASLHRDDARWRWAGPVEDADVQLTGFRVIGSLGQVFCEGSLDD